MTTKTNWGERLEPHEIEHERQIWREEAEKLTNAINAALANTELQVLDYRTTNYACTDCPEKPGECHLCLQDAHCTEFLRQQVAQLTIALQEKPTSG